ncbi:MAG TPA: iron ABC transporter permease [Candidatus Hydrogenedentes bacterium]|nr:iron ABC transporter permease [FCB group bacterium]HNV22360.1 iron ABC transporter permease [Candidatus Hydrogenedentota bacterium]HNZ16936.1 iron ABC transporter permease [Candidatus Hydrogenedentota bacterium]HOH32624.1 iron ABC transporter permease [Candidatus Hydrogenedentota bacterium]HPA04264.1 iron ABC transporter permease [Candidatus Hydrogenedentota bacterium]
MRRRHGGLMAAGLTAVSLAAVLASIGVGSESISFAAAWRDWCAGRPLADAPELAILLQHRLPRTLAALFAGGGLALAGCVFQALLRNPLATPYTLGVASAGAFGAYTATVVMRSAGLALALWGFSAVQVFAFVFALLDVSLIYLMAVRRHHVSSSVLLLAGITLGMLSNAGMMLVRFLSEPGMLAMMERWLMGGVDVIGYEPVVRLAAGVLPCSAVLLLQAAKFDQLGFGAEVAQGRGVNVRRLQTTTFLLGSFLTAVIVSEVGPIGFVGLIVPHAVRSLTGSRHRLLLPLSFVAGGAFLCLCDIFARIMLPGETPIGIITAFIGGPFFLYLLLRRRFGDWET